MPLRLPIGIDDFRTLRELGLEYVDKSQLICELIDRPGIQVVLLPRPRRFGKSLNLSMLRSYFERRDEDLSALFEDLSIWRAGDAYRAHFQRYPVIYLNSRGSRSSDSKTAGRASRRSYGHSTRPIAHCSMTGISAQGKPTATSKSSTAARPLCSITGPSWTSPGAEGLPGTARCHRIPST